MSRSDGDRPVSCWRCYVVSDPQPAGELPSGWEKRDLADHDGHGYLCPTCAQTPGLLAIPPIIDATDALEIVAKAVAAAAVRGMMRPEWENYPEIAEHDWEAIQNWLESHAESLATEIGEFSRACQVLASRADPNYA